MTDRLSLLLTVRDMTEDDLAGLSWLGSLHVAQVGAALRRTPPETKDFLIAVLPNGQRVAKAEVTYSEHAGEIGSVNVREEFRSLGIGTILMRTAEARIHHRGLSYANLDVEENNPRARSLYERLGYRAYGRQPDSWDQEAADGSAYRYDTVCILMQKRPAA